VKQHEAELDALKRALRIAGDTQASEYARGRSEAAAEAAPLRDAAAAVPRLQADLAKTRAALQEQLVRASSFDESEMLDRRVVKKLLVSEVALFCHWCFMWPPYAWCSPGGTCPVLCNPFLSQTLLFESATVQFHSLPNSLVDHVTPATSLDTMRLPVCPLAWLQVTYFQRPQNAHDILGLIGSMLVGDCAACACSGVFVLITATAFVRVMFW
jgi:hypothetical protein